MEDKTIGKLIMEYFKAHPKQDLKHAPVVDWVEEQYLSLYGKKPRDTWRNIRKLSQEGKLMKIRKGIYRYDPDYVHDVDLFDFPPYVKEAIYKRDNYRCVVCGLGREDGVDICVDHKKAKDKGGTPTVDNGQTLCYQHNLLKKRYSMTEAGKRFFANIYQDAVRNDDKTMISFCLEVFDIYDKYNIDTHIPRPQPDLFSHQKNG